MSYLIVNITFTMNCLVLTALLALAAPLISARSAPYIIGGRNARVGEFPHQGSLQVKVSDTTDLAADLLDSHTCGCVLVSSTWVATAAHCVGRGKDGLFVIFGMHKRGDNSVGAPTRYDIKKIIAHPGWGGVPGGDDMAMMEMATAVKQNEFVKPIAMAASGQNFDRKQCTITGWGVTQEGLIPGPPAETLQAADVDVVPLDTCLDSVPIVNDGHICVFKEDRSGACSGDSGGPLVCEGVLAGVTSFGIVGCFTTVPSVYASIPHFRNWITQVSGV